MPKRLIQQRRGKGSPTFKAPSHKFSVISKYRTYDDTEKTSKLSGTVVDLVHVRGKNAPVAVVKYETGEIMNVIAHEGMFVGQKVEIGHDASIAKGNILPLGRVPEGTEISNIELIPGDGGKIVKSAGNKATVVSRDDKKVMIMLPSRKLKKFDLKSRAMVGIIAGGGATEKPLLKAGKSYHAMKNKAKVWPVVAGTAMNAINHPHGGGGRKKKKRKTVSRHSPPGTKVGSIAPKRTGRKKKK
ncbi:MAG: 50S ribosomal protein L2 [Candidatus Nanoarchaeia archaeon]|nr:50S ribosomal protein L2 [Candidatus Nanoarchaeia archaeon]